MWAKALFEGIYGPKEAVTQNIIEDIVEDLDKARENSAKYVQLNDLKKFIRS